MGHCSHLSIEEREDVMLLGRQHKGVREIARAIGRDKSTVSGELARNSSATDAAPYHRASTARRKCERRRGRCRRQSLMGDPERRALVAAKLGDERWSPEQIEGRISEERPDLAVSDTTTYRAVWSGRLDCALSGRRKMSRMLRHRGKGRRRRGSQERRGRIAITHELSERPPEVSARTRLGDWEGDTVLGRAGGACLVTLVDRATGYLAGGPAPRKGKDEVADVAERSLADVPTQTLTLDRGKESAQARQTQERLGVPVYLCAPHHPWQRGTNENTDGLLRDFLPKGGGLDGATDAEVNAAYAMLNRRPRKRLKWKCPWEIYHRQSLHLL